MRDAVACFMPPVPREKISRYAARWAFGSMHEPWTRAAQASLTLPTFLPAVGLKPSTKTRIIPTMMIP